jgi:aminoglycoside/choline kinase family phosphotransferase
MINNQTEKLIALFEKWSKEKTISFSPLPFSGSARKYFRIKGNTKTAIGTINTDKRENNAFIYLTKYFLESNFNVPEIYASPINSNIYLQSDLGDQTLFSLLEQKGDKDRFDVEIISIYKKVIEQLPRFQINGSKKLDYSFCYPRAKFDKQSMMWDLNYFKYYFLKLAKIPFDEQKLEDDFNSLCGFLLQADSNYFLYRDLNSRNIMLVNEEPYFIDYQGGRKGALQYDIASLLYDSKAKIPPNLRQELLDHYINLVRKIKPIEKREFSKYYHGYVLIRLMQMFGAYGYRGYFEGKAHFLKSISLAQKNLEWLLENHRPKVKLPELWNALENIINSAELKKYDWNKHSDNKLTVHITSFSYREKIPLDLSGNGGGFVFDCRAIPNPGRLDEYKKQTGKDEAVQIFLNEKIEAQNFLKETFALIDQSVENYINRNWTDLIVNYGCTGGQHRSVYCAEKLAGHLRSKYDVIVDLVHTKTDYK